MNAVRATALVSILVLLGFGGHLLGDKRGDTKSAPKATPVTQARIPENPWPKAVVFAGEERMKALEALGIESPFPLLPNNKDFADEFDRKKQDERQQTLSREVSACQYYAEFRTPKQRNPQSTKIDGDPGRVWLGTYIALKYDFDHNTLPLVLLDWALVVERHTVKRFGIFGSILVPIAREKAEKIVKENHDLAIQVLCEFPSDEDARREAVRAYWTEKAQEAFGFVDTAAVYNLPTSVKAFRVYDETAKELVYESSSAARSAEKTGTPAPAAKDVIPEGPPTVVGVKAFLVEPERYEGKKILTRCYLFSSDGQVLLAPTRRGTPFTVYCADRKVEEKAIKVEGMGENQLVDVVILVKVVKGTVHEEASVGILLDINPVER